MDLSMFSSAVTGALNSLKLIKESATIAASDEVFKIQNNLLTIQAGYLECQGKLQAMIDKNRELEKSLAEQAAWEAQTARYAPFEIIPGVVVLRLCQNQLLAPEPIHYLCPDCFTQRKKFMLQAEPYSATRQCGGCQKKYFFEQGSPPVGNVFRGPH